MSCGNYSNGDSGQAQIGVLLPQEHLILTHELQNVWDCCASISQKLFLCFFDYLTIKMTFNIKEEST